MFAWIVIDLFGDKLKLDQLQFHDKKIAAPLCVYMACGRDCQSLQKKPNQRIPMFYGHEKGFRCH